MARAAYENTLRGAILLAEAARALGGGDDDQRLAASVAQCGDAAMRVGPLGAHVALFLPRAGRSDWAAVIRCADLPYGSEEAVAPRDDLPAAVADVLERIATAQAGGDRDA